MGGSMRDLFLKHFENSSPRGPSWLESMRHEAMKRFGEMGIPSTRQEAWKFTSLEALSRILFQPARVDQAQKLSEDPRQDNSLLNLEGIRLVFVNGFFSKSLSSTTGLPQGVQVGSLKTAFDATPDLESYLSKKGESLTHPFVALNTAFLQDGSFIRIPRGVRVECPIYLVYLTTAEESAIVSHPRNLIIAEEGSSARVIEIYQSIRKGIYLTNAVTEVHSGPGSAVEHYKIQDESESAFHLASMNVHQDRQSRFDSYSVSLGGALARNEINTVLAEEGAECLLNGLYLAGAKQHVDNQTSIDHAKPHGTSVELYKGILGGKSEAVFNGRILVRQDAQKTSARQTNRNLILSDAALINTRPLLEIFANDVKCNHGATIGRLDLNQIFYLCARGIGKEEAKALLTRAFANEILMQIPIEPLRDYLGKVVLHRLSASSFLEEAA